MFYLLLEKFVFIFFLKDGIPSSRETEDMLRMSKQNASNGIYTTFIGLGIDFNTNLVI